jgi:2-polyprenyl-6-methoxyphenol hydroxylase-like FAD-dependent oxidoreductase
VSARYDVVVAGARVAGASTALLLARAGLRVALVDRVARGTDTVSTHALMRAGVTQLSRWGVLPAVRGAGTPPVHRVLFHYPWDSVRLAIRPSPGVDALYAPRRTVLDPILLDAAATAGAEVLERVAVVGVTGDGTRVTGVRLRGRDGTEHEVRATLTVGADGIRSTVAAAVGAPVERVGTHGGAVLYAYRADLPTEGYEWAYGPGVAAGMIPTNEDLTCVFAGGAPDLIRAARREGADAALRALFAAAAPDHAPRLEASVAVGGLHGWAGLPGFVRRSWGAGWALVGDAGYFKDPITTHGMTDALRDAELLADAVVAGLSGAEPEAAALAGYQHRRDDLSQRLFEVTDRIASFTWPLDDVPGLLREASAAMTQEVEYLQALDSRGGTGPTAPGPVP